MIFTSILHALIDLLTVGIRMPRQVRLLLPPDPS